MTDNSSYKILILGGTGAMGTHLVDLLTGTSNEVIVTSRRPHPAHDNVRYAQGDAHDMNFVLPLLCAGVDIVVNFMTYSTPGFKDVVGIFLDHCKQYIHLSTARVYSAVDEVITEDTPRLLDVCADDEYLATDEYALTKARQEDILIASGRRNFTIVSPYITYSEKRLQLGVNEKETWLFRALKGHSIVFSEDITSRYTTLTYGRDVARGIIALMGQEEALGEAYHCTTEESILWADVLTLYLDILERVTGKRPTVCMQTLSPNLKGVGRYQVKYDRWYNRRFDNTKMKRFIGVHEFLSPREGIEYCLERFLRHPQFSKIAWRKEAELDRLSQESYPPFVQDAIKDMLRYFVYRYTNYKGRGGC